MFVSFDRFIYPTVSSFEVLLVAPSTWDIVPETSIKLDEWEHVISFKNVHLAYEGTRSGFREYICLGTNYNYSEDITSRGRVSFTSTFTPNTHFVHGIHTSSYRFSFTISSK